MKNQITDGERWKYLLFYDVDNPSPYHLEVLKIILKTLPTSYIMITTLHGIHVIGFTPLSSDNWGNCFEKLQRYVPSYYSGNVLRVSKKDGEVRRLIDSNFEQFPVTLNLYGIYYERFPELPSVFDLNIVGNYRTPFEVYRSLNE